MKEVWKDIPDVGGRFVRYQVSNMGNVRHVHLFEGEPTYTKPMKIYVEERTGVKTRRIVLRKGKKKQTYNVSQLVADAFVPNPKGYKFLKHINEDVLDDRAENLMRVSNPLLFYEYVIKCNCRTLAVCVRGTNDKHAIQRWHKALSQLLDFEKTYGVLTENDGTYYLDGKIITIERYG